MDLEEFYYLCKEGNLNSIILFCKTNNINKELITRKNNFVLYTLCKYGHLDACKWICSTFQIEKMDIRYDIDIFREICFQNHLDLCVWFYNYFQLTIEDVRIKYNHTLWRAVENNSFDVVKFLFYIVGLTENDALMIIDQVSENRKKELLKYAVPFGSYTKPAKNY